jgi:hypothetical protein
MLLLLFLLPGANSVLGESQVIRGNRGNQLLGVRIGLLHYTSSDKQTYPEGVVFSGAIENGFVAEAFYNYYFLDQLGLEISLGNANRGDIVFESDSIGRLFGAASVYPIAVGLKLTPLSGIVRDHYQPFLSAGGALVITRELFEGGYLTNPYDYYDLSTKSKTDVGWWVGGGFESYVSSTICVHSSLTYYGIDYSEPIAGNKDHSGYRLAFGIAYIFRKK